ncbi:MAG: Maf family protein [Candidatus Dormibacteraceae bacterium]
MPEKIAVPAVREKTQLVLASGSPRRAELLRRAGFEFTVCSSQVEEPPYSGGDPVEYAIALAQAKAAAVEGELVMGADTIVVLDHQVLGKPANSEQAIQMLRSLSGRSHRVITAVAVRRSREMRCDYAQSTVHFRRLKEVEIQSYVSSGEPLDKAGAYAIQGQAAAFVERLEGERDTVIGLPMNLLDRLLTSLRIKR